MGTTSNMDRINIQGHCFRCGEKIPEDRLTINIIGWLFSRAPGEMNWSAGYPCCVTFCKFCEDDMVRMTREFSLQDAGTAARAEQDEQVTPIRVNQEDLTGKGDWRYWPPAS